MNFLNLASWKCTQVFLTQRSFFRRRNKIVERKLLEKKIMEDQYVGDSDTRVLLLYGSEGT